MREGIMLKIDNKKVTPNQVAKEIVISNIDYLANTAIDQHLDYGSNVFDGEPTSRERRLIIDALKKHLIRTYALHGIDIQAAFERRLGSRFSLWGES
jgi:hypothetical protein